MSNQTMVSDLEFVTSKLTSPTANQAPETLAALHAVSPAVRVKNQPPPSLDEARTWPVVTREFAFNNPGDCVVWSQVVRESINNRIVLATADRSFSPALGAHVGFAVWFHGPSAKIDDVTTYSSGKL